MKRFGIIWLCLLIAVLVGGLVSLKGQPLFLLMMTPDQYGQRLYNQGRFEDAFNWFSSAEGQGAALYRDGKFKDAAGRFAGSSSATAFYNQGNALAMQGQYADAANRYIQALELRPNWAEAVTNLEIARLSAARLEQKGGESTGGQLGADDFVFSNTKPDPSSSKMEDPVQESSASDAQTVWLRQVQTRPSDFLRSKFSYQNAAKQEGRKE